MVFAESAAAVSESQDDFRFSARDGWKFRSYRNRLTCTFGEDRSGVDTLVVHGPTAKMDIAWCAVSKKIPVPADAHEFVLSVEAKCPKLVLDQGDAGESWNNAIAWYSADGRKISAQPVRRMVFGRVPEFTLVNEGGVIPGGAVACTVQFGFDKPDIRTGETVEYRNFRLKFAPKGKSDAYRLMKEGENAAWLVDRLYPSGGRSVPAATLRDDGMTLVDGRPFFPIGIYSVCKCEFNGHSFDKAFAGLKESGFNFAHTYGDSYDLEFLAAAGKHGIKMWVQSRMPDEKMLNAGRRDPSILAWYLGDDTSSHRTPQELMDDHAAVKAVDPFRLTCQADVISSDLAISRYAAYVRGTDVFMPEIYPVRRKSGDKTDKTCVAEAIRDMKRVASDVRTFGDGRPRGCWPIIQYFKGWGDWGHFPSESQLSAMTWATVIHGANGVTWYTYGGTRNGNEGVTSTPERWAAISKLASELRRYSPVLLERTPKAQPSVVITEGPSKDPLGQEPSVSVLLKRHKGRPYLFAVNASPEPVTAHIRMPDGNTFTERFQPFGVVIK